MKTDSNLTKDQLIQFIDNSLYGMAYMDIERASIQGDAKLAGFILGACFIDALASFYAGVNSKTKKSGSGKRFKEFVERYLNNYDAEKLWEDLRCGLVHSYAEGGTYLFTDKNKAGIHMQKTMNGMIILNLEDFCADIKKAYQEYRNDILVDDDCFLKAKHRYESMGLMGLVVVQVGG